MRTCRPGSVIASDRCVYYNTFKRMNSALFIISLFVIVLMGQGGLVVKA